MTNLVSADDIEKIVGAPRHRTMHLGIANSEDGQFYILHSKECKSSGIDLRECEFSVALDEYGVEFWEVDTPLILHIDAVVGEIFTDSYEDYEND